MICRRCKNEFPIEGFAKDRFRKDGFRYICRKCSSEEFKKWKKTPGYIKRLDKQKAQRRALKISDPKLRWARMTKNAVVVRSKKRGETTDITVSWLYEVAPTICPLLDVVLRYDGTRSGPFSAALDRKDNNLGYTQANCWVISMKANRIKTDATVEEVEMVALNLRKLMG